MQTCFRQCSHFVTITKSRRTRPQHSQLGFFTDMFDLSRARPAQRAYNPLQFRALAPGLVDLEMRAHRANADVFKLAGPIAPAPVTTPLVQAELTFDFDHDLEYRARPRAAESALDVFVVGDTMWRRNKGRRTLAQRHGRRGHGASKARAYAAPMGPNNRGRLSRRRHGLVRCSRPLICEAHHRISHARVVMGRTERAQDIRHRCRRIFGVQTKLGRNCRDREHNVAVQVRASGHNDRSLVDRITRAGDHTASRARDAFTADAHLDRHSPIFQGMPRNNFLQICSR